MNIKSFPAILLGVNVDHVATLRQARRGTNPDPVAAALLAEDAGADSITVHLREDRRHIQDHDVERLQAGLRTRMNLEMAVAGEIVAFACRVRPRDCCLVPERRQELTTEGGLDVAARTDAIRDVVQRLADHGIRVALFIDPDGRQIEASVATGARVVELHTGEYADAAGADRRAAELERLQRAARLAAEAGLTVHAGHGLNYSNVATVAAIPEVAELNIGHSIVARAVFTGLPAAVAEMKRIMSEARSR
jgi:pyridoxine 5-phosphate synthase